MTKFIKPLAYVIVLLLASSGVSLGLNARSDDNSMYRVTAYFEKAIGLFANSDVTILGVAVGKVHAVEPEGTAVRVEMNIDSDYKVPADAFAQIVPISVISDRYVQLAPVYEGGATLQDGAIIGINDTQIPAELDDVFKQLKKLLDAIEPGSPGEPGALGDLVVQLNETLSDREEDLKSTLINGAELTNTLADAQGDLSGLLINLEDLFSTLSSRASKFGSLNSNLATVMTTLAESRLDVEQVVFNLAELTEELGDIVREHGDRLGRDLNLAARITSTVLENRASVEESLSWLPVVGLGVANAYHSAPQTDIDVRDNATSARCEAVEDLPQEVQDALDPVLDALCGTERPDAESTAPVIELPERELDCDQGVKRIERQLRKVVDLDVPDAVRQEIIRPLKRNLRRLAKECKELGQLLQDEKPQDLVKDVIEKLLGGVGGVPEIEEPIGENLEGMAAGAFAVPTSGASGIWSRLGSWFGGLLSFVGGSA